MVEEAAGTKLYESKKESAQKTIEKKDAKLREMDNVSNRAKTKGKTLLVNKTSMSKILFVITKRCQS